MGSWERISANESQGITPCNICNAKYKADQDNTSNLRNNRDKLK